MHRHVVFVAAIDASHGVDPQAATHPALLTRTVLLEPLTWLACRCDLQRHLQPSETGGGPALRCSSKVAYRQDALEPCTLAPAPPRFSSSAWNVLLHPDGRITPQSDGYENTSDISVSPWPARRVEVAIGSTSGGSAVVAGAVATFDSPVRAVAPHQSLVVYGQGGCVLGSAVMLATGPTLLEMS